jgi:hypothetical protein
MTTLELKAQHDALQKIATVRDPIKAIAEFVWNALDADATHVSVELRRNAMGGLDEIAVRDDGVGISKVHALADFENLGASWKRSQARTEASRILHGKEGQGRLRFFSIAQKAHWVSAYRTTKGVAKLHITINAGSLHKSEVEELPLEPSLAATGTIVELYPLKDGLEWLGSEEARSDFAAIFAPYVLQYPGVRIEFDGKLIDPAVTIASRKDFEPVTIVGPNRTIENLALRVIEWKHSVGGRKIYLGGEAGVVLGSIPANVTAPEFEFSAYAYAPYFQELAQANLLDFDGLTDPDYHRAIEYIRDTVGDYFRARRAERSGGLIQELKDAGLYPYEGEPQSDVEVRERQVFDIATHAVSSYSRDFKRAEDPLKKITLGLLREAVRHNPEAIHHILHHVFNLPKNRQDEFSNLLHRTNLGNIISASTLIADRIVALEVLKGMVFSPKHRTSAKERGELDILVQSNTWMFGENFHITLPEAGLSRIMERVSAELTGQSSRRKVVTPDGSIGRADVFVGRVVPSQNQLRREFLLVELKRPSLTIGTRETDQLEKYVNTIRTQPDFAHTDTYWHFYLVTGEYDETVNERITQSGRPLGLMLDKATHRVWVKTWGEIVRECEARLHFISEKLQIEVKDSEIEERIRSLKSSILRTATHSNPEMAAAE